MQVGISMSLWYCNTYVASSEVSPQLAAVLTLTVCALLYGSLGPALRGLFALDGPPTPATLSFLRQVLTVGLAPDRVQL